MAEDRAALEVLHRHVLCNEQAGADTDTEMVTAMRKFHTAWCVATARERRVPALTKFHGLLCQGQDLAKVRQLLALPPCVEVMNVEVGTMQRLRQRTGGLEPLQGNLDRLAAALSQRKQRKQLRLQQFQKVMLALLEGSVMPSSTGLQQVQSKIEHWRATPVARRQAECPSMAKFLREWKHPLAKELYNYPDPGKRKREDRLDCTVCCEEERQEVWGCGHMVACTACSAQLAECPICRQKISTRKRVFLS